MSKTVFFFKLHSLVYVHSLVLFDPWIGLWDREDLGAMAIKVYSAFPQIPALLEPHHYWSHIQDTRRGGILTSAEMQLVYSTALADWAE